ncbi:hypothetical protein FZC35_01975 [Candidatus Cytomitobacter indipagum]|uniref:Uncharacterized protein n=1 Tax=Candidatus Cytomitobacter indipagum TaxID=2601575 RepID=A0A5C0UFV0_9PROT|nr:hypothetical protein [Candidatus Cytomitobacter indipagum]QEK38132.1 hypothetical protein FZC35_01975 [Candidatus Cytomitobacter indipagum]
MFLSILSGNNEIIHESVHMIGFSSSHGMRAIYTGHQNFITSIPANLLFVLFEKGHKLYSIGDSMIKKKKENLYVITNCINKNQKYKIQTSLEKIWKEKYDGYKPTWTKENWFEKNIDQAKDLAKKIS